MPVLHSTPNGIVKMYESGMSLPQIARKTGRSIRFLRERLLALGVKMRPRGGAENGRLGNIKQAHERFLAKQRKAKMQAEREGHL